MALLQLRRIDQADGKFMYQCNLQKHSAPGTLVCHRTFTSENEMIETMRGILATQTGERDISEVLVILKKNGSFEFADELDLTEEQVEELCRKQMKGEQSL